MKSIARFKKAAATQRPVTDVALKGASGRIGMTDESPTTK